VDAVTRVLARELGPSKIRVNSINPGPVDTEGVRSSGIDGSDRIGQPENIAPIAVFLAPQDSMANRGNVIGIRRFEVRRSGLTL
jgi:3-oxoacyl-[acyl-carrier protein] reductase